MLFTDNSNISPFIQTEEQYHRAQLIERSSGVLIEDFVYSAQEGIPSDEKRRIDSFMRDGIYDFKDELITRNEFLELIQKAHGSPVVYRFGRV